MHDGSDTGPGALLERIGSEVHTAAEGHTTLDRKIDRVAQELHKAIGGVDEKAEWLLQRVNAVDGRVGRVEAAVLSLSGEMKGEMKAGFARVLKAIGDLGARLDAHDRAHAN